MFPWIEAVSGAGLGVLVVAFSNGLRRIPYMRSERLKKKIV